jgi:hypothetical protein
MTTFQQQFETIFTTHLVRELAALDRHCPVYESDAVTANRAEMMGCVERAFISSGFALGRAKTATEVMEEREALVTPLRAAYESQLAGLRSQLAQRREREAGNIWFWQGDGEDHLESLVCDVVIPAEKLRRIVDACNEYHKTLQTAGHAIPTLLAGATLTEELVPAIQELVALRERVREFIGGNILALDDAIDCAEFRGMCSFAEGLKAIRTVAEEAQGIREVQQLNKPKYDPCDPGNWREGEACEGALRKETVVNGRYVYTDTGPLETADH